MSLPPLPLPPDPLGLFPGLPNLPFSVGISKIGNTWHITGTGPVAAEIVIYSDKTGFGDLQQVGSFLIRENGHFDVPMQIQGMSARMIQIHSAWGIRKFAVNPRTDSIVEKLDETPPSNAALPLDTSPSQAVLQYRQDEASGAHESPTQYQIRHEAASRQVMDTNKIISRVSAKQVEPNLPFGVQKKKFETNVV